MDAKAFLAVLMNRLRPTKIAGVRACPGMVRPYYQPALAHHCLLRCPHRRQHVDRVEGSAQERQRRDDQRRNELELLEALRPHTP
jgi:hypothetical protein